MTHTKKKKYLYTWTLIPKKKHTKILIPKKTLLGILVLREILRQDPVCITLYKQSNS